MFSMIIVDDEPLTRQGIRESVNWELMDIEIVGEAGNGFDAMLLIHDLDPDIIICDIRMPKLDGISLINEVQSSHPNLQVLFLSGYSDKEYLKHAIRLEAVDYIFKPFQLHELVAAIEKAKKNSLKQKESRVNADIALELLRYTKDTANLPIYANLPIDLSAPMLSMIIKINRNFNDIPNACDSAINDKLCIGKYCSEIEKISSNLFNNCFVLSFIGSGFVLHANAPADFVAKSENANFFNPFFEEIQDSCSSMSIGVSTVINNAEFIMNAYQQAHDASRATFLIGRGKVIFYSELNKTSYNFTSSVNDFYEHITNNHFSSAISWLENYIEQMTHGAVMDIPKIRDMLASIIFWLNERISRKSPEDNGYVTEIVNNAGDINNIKDYILKQIDYYVSEIANLDNKSRVLLEVEQYIRKNYDKDLSIKTIAQQVFITPNYLCYLYKKKTGKTINSFILDVKMEKARKMICETEMRFSDISDELGYANQNYFTRIFTKYFEMSPRTYRNRHSIIERLDSEQ